MKPPGRIKGRDQHSVPKTGPDRQLGLGFGSKSEELEIGVIQSYLSPVKELRSMRRGCEAACSTSLCGGISKLPPLTDSPKTKKSQSDLLMTKVVSEGNHRIRIKTPAH